MLIDFNFSFKCACGHASHPWPMDWRRVCPSVILSMGGRGLMWKLPKIYWTSMHSPPPQHGTRGTPAPASDIWWQLLETFPNLFKLLWLFCNGRNQNDIDIITYNFNITKVPNFLSSFLTFPLSLTPPRISYLQQFHYETVLRCSAEIRIRMKYADQAIFDSGYW